MSSLVVTNRDLQSEEKASVDKDFADRISVKYYKNINFRREKLNDEGKVVEIEYFIEPINTQSFNNTEQFNEESAKLLKRWNNIVLNKINSISNYFHFNMVSDPKENTDYILTKQKANKAKKFWLTLIKPDMYHTINVPTEPRPIDGKKSYKSFRWNGYREEDYESPVEIMSMMNGATKKGRELFQKEILLGNLSQGELNAVSRIRIDELETYLRDSENKKRRDEEISIMKAEIKKNTKALKKQHKKAKKEAKKFLKGKVKEGRKIEFDRKQKAHAERVRAERAAKKKERAAKKERELNQEMSSLFPSDKFEPIVSTEGQLKMMKKISPKGSPEAEGFSNELKAKEAWNKLTRSKNKSQGGRKTRRKRKSRKKRRKRKSRRKTRNKKGGHHEAIVLGALALSKIFKKKKKKKKKKTRKKRRR